MSEKAEEEGKNREGEKEKEKGGRKRKSDKGHSERVEPVAMNFAQADCNRF